MKDTYFKGGIMLVEYFKTLYDYNYWANAKILEATEQVSEARFIEETPESHGSLRGTLVHMLSAEWIWRSRWQGTSPMENLREEDLPTLEALRERWREEERQMRAFLATLGEEEVQRVVRYTNTRGQTYAAPLWQMMGHLVNHGTQHRSEAAVILSRLGHSPGDLDLLIFLLG
jgi:uncharacterized damage-inducible protein DinB